MHLKIQPSNSGIKAIYENHTSYHEGDSGLDLFINERIVVPAKELSFKIDTCISCEAFRDKSKQGGNISYYLYPRSSIYKTPIRLSNSVGIIDAGYRGNIMACVDNHSDNDYKIEKGTRLFQICAGDLSIFHTDIVNNLSNTNRNIGGFGSTGN